MRNIVTAEHGVTPGGHFSHAVVANGLVFVSGQTPVDPKTGAIPEAFAEQVRRCLENLLIVLAAAGCGKEDVVKVNTFLSDTANFPEYDAVYKEFFGDGPPARTTVGADLAGFMVEIDCIAALSDGG